MNILFCRFRYAACDIQSIWSNSQFIFKKQEIINAFYNDKVLTRCIGVEDLDERIFQISHDLFPDYRKIHAFSISGYIRQEY